jgi:hypothetical protein
MRNAPKQPVPERESSGQFVDGFYAKDLLDALNGKRDFGKEQYVVFHGDQPMQTGSDGKDEGYRIAGEVFIAELRKLIDAWLESGRSTDGVETPKDRKVTATRSDLDSFYLDGNGHTIFDSVRGWLMDDPPLFILTNTGEVNMELRRTSRRSSSYGGPVAMAVDEALTLFLLLMASKAKYALFKCNHPGCGIYYILEKPRGQYKQGTACPEHRRQQGTRRKRKLDHAKALQIASEALAAWPSLSGSTRSKHKSAKDYAASKLQRFGVGSKWVTRNLTKISNREVSTHA